jgi:hypothetical protein
MYRGEQISFATMSYIVRILENTVFSGKIGDDFVLGLQPAGFS